MSEQQPYCLATVTSENYFQWTMTMLYSFVTSNPWFRGDIVVICKDLPAEMLRGLNLFNQVRIIAPAPVIEKKLDEISESIPKFKSIASRFYSLEIFRLGKYHKLLFLDSDMIVTGSVEELFRLPGSFYASAELCWYKGKGRSGSNFLSGFREENLNGFIEKPVNTGFMLVDGSVLGSLHYDALVNRIQPGLWENNTLIYTDELIINLYFKGKITLLDTRYNYRARAARIVKEKENVAFEDAKIIHYYSKFKPWNFSEVLATSARNINWLKAYETWYNWYFRFLKFYHLQQKISGFKQESDNVR